ncbi:hypothetical protein MW887_009916 [Aspergillus wentii]|nr:hypothetical protein MW887_009916 [Aspergillus wentii]
MGKIVCTVDLVQQTIFFLNEVAPPVGRFWYDFLGQLVKASGPEQVNVAHGSSKQLKLPEFNAVKASNTKGDGNVKKHQPDKGGKNHLKGADFNIRISDKDDVKEITLQYDNPIGTALHLLSPAINEVSGEFGAGLKTLCVGSAENELLHGFNGSSNKQLLLPRRDRKLYTIGADDASHSSPARGAEGGSDPGYKYEFRIDWDERKQARDVNMQVSRGKQSYKYAIFHKNQPDGPEPIVHDQLLNALHEEANTLTLLQNRFANRVHGHTSGQKVKS